MQMILASASPRRRELLSALGLSFEVRPALGEEHPDTAMSCNNIGAVYDSLGDYDKALEYYRKALKINIKLYGEEYSKVQAIKKKIEEVKAKKEEEK